MPKRKQEWQRLLAGCRYDGDSWQGRAFVPCWRAELSIRLLTSAETEPAPAQIQSLIELLSRREDLKSRVQRRLFRYYKDEVQGMAGYYDPESGGFEPDPDAPPLRRSADVWPLVGEPEVWVDDRPWRTGTTWVLAFACRWDREHGLGVRFQRGRIVDIGGAAEV